MKPRALFLCTFLSPLLWGGYAAPAAESVGRTLRAAETVRADGEIGKRVMNVNDAVFFMDRIQTNRTGVGEFQFSDGSKLAVGPSASIVVDEFVAKSRSSYKKLGLGAAKGAFRWISGRSASSAYQIDTPRGTLSIRGTALDITVGNGRVYAALISGRARFCDTNRRCQTLEDPCDFVEVRRGGISDVKPVSAGFKSRQEAARIFPFLDNPNRLTSRFRVGGGSCLSNIAAKPDREQGSYTNHKGWTGKNDRPPPPPPPSDPG